MIIENIEYKKFESVWISKCGIIRANNMMNRIRNPYNANGYLTIKIRVDNRIYKTFLVHRLIYLTWKGFIPYQMEINHLDFNKHNNHIDNLELVTKLQNTTHAKLGGRYKTGTRDVNRLLAMRLLRENDWSNYQIACAFQVSQPAVSTLLKKYPKNN